MKNGWFDVDKDGLKQLHAGRPKFYVIRELIQNAWDEPGVTECSVVIEKVGSLVQIMVLDNAPEGFYNLSHAYTLFADTRKRGDPEKRGRFNMGEKEVFAICKAATVQTTTGTVKFLDNGTRIKSKEKTGCGSLVSVWLKMSQAEVEGMIKYAETLIPPCNIVTKINGLPLEQRTPSAVFEATITTEVGDEEALRKVMRKTAIAVYRPKDGEEAMVYEMGLPICPTGDKWHYNIQQRVPLSIDRDKVDTAWLQMVRAEVLNRMYRDLACEDSSEKWVRDATASKRIEPAAVITVADLRWGKDRVVADPTDRRSVEEAITRGYHIVAGRELSGAEWEQYKAAGAIPSSSQLFPTKLTGFTEISRDQWTGWMIGVKLVVDKIAKIVGFDDEITVRMIKAKEATTAADYGDKTIRFNVALLGEAWFKPENLEEQIDLTVHELAHEFGGHLDKSYQRALSRFAAKLALNWR